MTFQQFRRLRFFLHFAPHFTVITVAATMRSFAGQVSQPDDLSKRPLSQQRFDRLF